MSGGYVNSNEIENSSNETRASIHNIDQLAANTPPDIGNSRVTSVAQKLLNYDPEALIWQDSSSLSFMFSNVLKWTLIFIIWIMLLVHYSPKKSEPIISHPEVVSLEATKETKKNHESSTKKKKIKDTENQNTSSEKYSSAPENNNNKFSKTDTYYTILAIGALIFSIQLLRMIARACSIASIKYSMTSQRLKIDSGVFSKTSNIYELHSLENGQIYTPFFMNIFGRSNLYISGIWLIGIKNAEVVRDLIRNAGQIEASRIEKARFR